MRRTCFKKRSGLAQRDSLVFGDDWICPMRIGFAGLAKLGIIVDAPNGREFLVAKIAEVLGFGDRIQVGAAMKSNEMRCPDLLVVEYKKVTIA